MLALAFIKWWYTSGWHKTFKRAGNYLSDNLRMFSVETLLKNLFDPWKRITTSPGSGINAHAQAFMDNAVSRMVGFFVRIFVLLAALISSILFVLIGLIEIVIWPLLPPAVIVFLILGFIK